jgi:hypothetical protein
MIMKQQGTSWITHDGQSTLAKYIPTHEKLFEKLGQRIVAEAIIIEDELFKARKMFVDTCKEALRNSPNRDNQRRFTFTTFDKEYKIEFDIKEEYVRIYRATKADPSAKDYELINLDFNVKTKPEVATGESLLEQPGLFTEESNNLLNN